MLLQTLLQLLVLLLLWLLSLLLLWLLLLLLQMLLLLSLTLLLLLLYWLHLLFVIIAVTVPHAQAVTTVITMTGAAPTLKCAQCRHLPKKPLICSDSYVETE